MQYLSSIPDKQLCIQLELYQLCAVNANALNVVYRLFLLHSSAQTAFSPHNLPHARFLHQPQFRRLSCEGALASHLSRKDCHQVRVQKVIFFPMPFFPDRCSNRIQAKVPAQNKCFRLSQVLLYRPAAKIELSLCTFS